MSNTFKSQLESLSMNLDREAIEWCANTLATVSPVELTKDIVIGGHVIFTNDYGVKFLNRVTGFETSADKYDRNIYLDTDCYWFAKRESNLTPVEVTTLSDFNGESVAYFQHDDLGLCEITLVENKTHKMTKDLMKLSNVMATNKVIHFKQCGCDKTHKSVRDNKTVIFKA